MREEEDPNWFSRWEEELPSPEELTPLSQTLITSSLALAFDIPLRNPNPNPSPNPPSPDRSPPPGSPDRSTPPDPDSARTLKRPRLVWTPQLHKRFVDAVAHLGIKNAVPKTIMQLMSVDGLTRENVASHLQKYRLYLKRMQGLGPSAPGPPLPMSAADAATEQLFASNPIPHPLLARGAPDSFMQFMAPPLLHHHHQMAAAAAAAQHQYYQRQLGHFGSGLDHGFHARTGGSGLGLGRMPGPAAGNLYDGEEDVDERAGGARRVLTLFPACGED